MISNMNSVEKSIITNIDQLVKLIIKMSQAENGEDAGYLQEAEEIIISTNPFLLQLLKGKEEFLEQMYRQLISQKLPNAELLKSFGKLENVLKKVFLLPVFTKGENVSLRSVLAISDASAEVNTETKTEPPTINMDERNMDERSEFILERFIQFRYPEEKIIKDYYLHSTKLNYLLPVRKLAVMLTPNYYRLPHSLNSLVRQAGLILITITPQELHNLHLLSKKFSYLTSSK